MTRLPFLNILILTLLTTSPAISSGIEIEYNFNPEYSAVLSLSNITITKYDFERVSIPVIIQNTGLNSWNSFAKIAPVFLSYHLLSQNSGEVLQHDNIRTSFRKEILPGEKTLINLKLEPLSFGVYIIQIDLVVEGMHWFKKSDTKPLNLLLNIISSTENLSIPIYELESVNSKLIWYVEGQSEINYCAFLSQKILENNFHKFLFQGKSVYGFSAGLGYQQIWIRDSSTIMPIARYLYPESILTSWIMAHLSLQKQSGELQDWLMENNKYGKNNTESDQESNLVIAAHEISKTIGYTWLLNDINSRSILARLNDAMNYLFDQRLDVHTGLIKSGHTADWGDVTNEFTDERALQLHDSSKEVVGIYTNSLVFSAMKKLSYMFSSLGDINKSIFWTEKATILLKNIQRYLWQEDMGFFRVHQYIDFKDHDYFDEGNIFPMGGNALSIEAGVATSTQIQRIFHQAIVRQKIYNMSTISGTLLPPYPKDFFKHPIMNDTFEYQNGGQWDWFGGRFVLQMFIHDNASAFFKMTEICQKAIINKNFFEWDTVNGQGEGSPQYTGNAAAISRMIVEGLFGINWSDTKIRIQPRLAQNNGYIYVPQVDNNQFLSYVYKNMMPPDTDKLIIKYSFGSNIQISKTFIFPKSFGKYHYSGVSTIGDTILLKQIVTEQFIEIHLNTGRSDFLIEYKQSP